ncbi:type I restriction endonuclease subunit R [Candidatus Poriferisodalis sp.]|uniref:type I restriction endonuclease subunit R n=1 Tax=Candidatus Poriferisodalis sp. TaxID=3101277 RepID=UPI003B024ABC
MKSEQADEAALESTIVSMLTDVGWAEGDRAEWDVDLALFPARVVAFLQSAQPELWAEMAALHGGDLEDRIIATLARELDKKGTLDVLRHGFKFYGKTHRLAWFKPAHSLNPEAVQQFASNELSVTRQVRCHPGEADTVDLVMALNGVPVATCELKNPSSNQHWRDAVRQYREDRDPNAPLFRFRKRALVHFAADTEQVHMTTRLAKASTRFLPFNRGSHPGEVTCGAGNPQHPSGYRTGYLWQEVLERERFLEVIGSYMFLERRDEAVSDHTGTRTAPRETLVFPRFHQLHAVEALVETARAEGPGHNYLIQHSAGSGKTNSISWLAHHLSSLHSTKDEKVFNCVLVITDRRVLDAQLQQAIYQIEHAQGVVQAIDQDSQQLAQALVDNTKIVITTLQKFPFVMRQLLRLAGADSGETPDASEHAQAAEWAKKLASRKYAIIVDEAHSSQTGESAHDMKSLLGAAGATGDEAPEDWEDGLNAVVASRGRQPNLSFFAFTATPKGKTIELFGRPGSDGKPEPFHSYSMRQAIEEGFILDVLGNYTDYDTFYRLVKTAEEDPQFPRREAAKKLARFSQLHAHRLEQQTSVIIEHFREHVRPCMGGRGKAMVVASSRLHAVRYMETFTKYIDEQGYEDVRPLVAFSGAVSVPGLDAEYTEPKMNIDVITGKPISESALPERFASPDYQILIVAEKYQTGFDQPLLQAMYVDKRLSGVHAVQTLSRLNRVASGKQAPFVLDFVNSHADIAAAFAPYFDVTQLREASDPYHLEKLKHDLNEMQVYYETEIAEFAQVFYLPLNKQRPSDHARIETALQPAVDRFADLDAESQVVFRDRLNAYVSLYAFLSQIIPYADCELERLYSYGRKLLPHLHVGGDFTPIHLDGDVDLEYYRLQRMSSGAISLNDEVDASVASPTDVGTELAEDDTAPLSEIIELLNDRFSTDFTESDRLFLQQIQEDGLCEEAIRETARANDFDKFRLGAFDRVKQLLIARLAGNDSIVDKCLSDEEFGEFVITGILQSIFDAVQATSSTSSGGD